MNERAHGIGLLISQTTRDASAETASDFAQSHQRLHCLHKLSMDEDECSDQALLNSCS